MTVVKAGDASSTKDVILSKLAPVLALKLAASQPTSNFQKLKIQEQQQAWAVFADVLPTILAQCSGLSTHPNNGRVPFCELLWDFQNGREICISLNKSGGFNLSIDAEKVHWMETQLPLDRCCHINSPSLHDGMPFVDQATFAAIFHAANASNR